MTDKAGTNPTGAAVDDAVVIARQLFRRRGGRGHRFAEEPEPPAPDPERRPARVALMLAFAHWINGAIERELFRDQAAVARHFGVTRARLSQVLDLTLLAPEIQERVLELEAVGGKEPMSERGLRRVLRSLDWGEQETVWNVGRDLLVIGRC